MSDYPLGAKYDSNAPYNEKPQKISLCVSVTYHKDIEIEVEGNPDEVMLNYLAREVTYSMHSHMDDLGWAEDEFEVVRE